MKNCVLVGHLSTWHNIESSSKVKPQIRKYMHQLDCRQDCEAFSWWMIPVGGKRSLYVVPPQDMWSHVVYMKKAKGKKKTGWESSLHNFSFSSCLQVPALTPHDRLWNESLCQINPFFSKLCLVKMFYHSNRKKFWGWRDMFICTLEEEWGLRNKQTRDNR